MMLDRMLKVGEKHACEVGSGECSTDASWVMDDGYGRAAFYVCLYHYNAMRDFEVTLRALPQEKLIALDKAIRAQEQIHAKDYLL